MLSSSEETIYISILADKKSRILASQPDKDMARAVPWGQAQVQFIRSIFQFCEQFYLRDLQIAPFENDCLPWCYAVEKYQRKRQRLSITIYKEVVNLKKWSKTRMQREYIPSFAFNWWARKGERGYVLAMGSISWRSDTCIL